MVAALALSLVALCGCRTCSYYRQAIDGECEILIKERRIDKLIAEPSTPEKLRERLRLVQELRAYAKSDLKLPVDGHYLRYVDLHRDCVVWNVEAAPRFSLESKTWWYPLVGSLDYRGYFSEEDAQKYGRFVEQHGYDVYVGGVEAYSTLGWFKDPVLNTFIYNSPPELAETLFHELGHQRVFASGDTDFNEAYATTVGETGARQWLRSKGDAAGLKEYNASLHRNDQFVALIAETRARLIKLYGDTLDEDGGVTAAPHPPLPADQLQAGKTQILQDLRERYARLKTEWGGFGGYDDWFAEDLNNAKLNSVATYYDLVPAFERLLALHGGNWEEFYKAVERLARMKKAERHRWLDKLGKGGRESP